MAFFDPSDIIVSIPSTLPSVKRARRRQASDHQGAKPHASRADRNSVRFKSASATRDEARLSGACGSNYRYSFCQCAEISPHAATMSSIRLVVAIGAATTERLKTSTEKQWEARALHPTGPFVDNH